MNAAIEAPTRVPAAGIGAGFFHDPYPTYRAWREAGPVLWSEDFFGGAWLVTRHAEVAQVLRDPRLSARRTGGWVMQHQEDRGELTGFQRLFARALLFLDEPDHGRVHGLLHAVFRPAALQRLIPAVERTVDELLDAADTNGCFDFMSAIARPLPARVIAELLGVRGAAHAEITAWSEDLSTFLGSLRSTRHQARRAQASLLAMARCFEESMAARRPAPGDDLIAQLLQAEARGDLHDRAELLAQCVMLLFAGYETTRNLLGNGLHALLSHPAQWQRLKADPLLIAPALRELLRYESPVQYTGRRVTTDFVMHGQPVRRGDLVIALIGAANRDPRQHERPDELDIGRTPRPSLAFGTGPHVCIGAALTMLEGETLLRRLLKRRPNLRLLDTSPRWSGSSLYRGLSELTVT